MIENMENTANDDNAPLDMLERMRDAIRRSKCLVREAEKQITEADKLIRRNSELRDRQVPTPIGY